MQATVPVAMFGSSFLTPLSLVILCVLSAAWTWNRFFAASPEEAAQAFLGPRPREQPFRSGRHAVARHAGTRRLRSPRP